MDALSRSDHYYVKEVLEHLGGDAFAAVEGFLSAMKPAIKVMVTTTAAGAALGAVGGSFFFGIGAAPGAVFGAEVGAEAGVALLTLMGLGYLIPWIGDTLDEVGACLKGGASTAWNSGGSSTQVDQAAQQFGHARALLARAILQALIQYALAKGLKAASEQLRSAKGGQQAIDWLERNTKQRVSVVQQTAGERFNPPKLSYTYDMINNPGPLATTEGTLAALKSSPAGNFIGGKYNETVLSRPTVFYRAQPKPLLKIDSSGNYDFNPSVTVGRWFTAEPPPSAAAARINSALPDHWVDSQGNYSGTSSAEVVVAVRLPAGTKVYYGPTSSQGGVLAGGMDRIQVYVPDIDKLAGVEVLSEKTLQLDTMSPVIEEIRKYR